MPVVRLLRLVLVASVVVLAVPGTAGAHSYADPALRTVLDGIQPAPLPAGVSVAVVPSVVDQLVVTNPTSEVLEVLATGGEAFLRVSSAGVLANLNSPDWYLTGTPEGGAVPAGLGAAPRWARVSKGSTWAEFDPRLHPAVQPSAAQRRAGRDAVLAVWRVPLRFGTTSLAATGHVLFSPVRGAFTVAVTTAPAGLTVNALQGELPGLFVRSSRDLTVTGRDGKPFLRHESDVWRVEPASPSWLDNERAKGRAVPTGTPRTTQVARGPSYSWLDSRLRYPHDLPPEQDLGSRTVVQRWRVPVTVGGATGAIEGTVTWEPRVVGGPLPHDSEGSGRSWGWLVVVASAVVLAVSATWIARRPRARGAQQ
ncbi:MAG: hypothetical protein JWO22_1892 [Frankiales bacterium]|nr:hypothetical protein [Frankiales bacterium]